LTGFTGSTGTFVFDGGFLSMNLRKKVHAETRRRGEKTEEAFYRLFQEPRLLGRFMVPMHSKIERGLSMNQRINAHPSS
jgi:hypothetical protein